MLRYALGANEIFQESKSEKVKMKYTYFLINFFTVLVPFLFSFNQRNQFYKYFKPFFYANILTGLLFVLWDAYFTKMKVWGFNPDYIFGVYLLNLPLEEVLFFVCVPFACVFSYHSLKIFYKAKWSAKTENRIVLLFAIALFSIGFLYFDRAYTSVTFISLAFLILVLKYLGRVTWLPQLFTVYPILLIPFFIVNGLLTGTGLEQPVVWYNNDENLGIRLLTIPVEDIAYGFELILLNVFLFEYFSVRFSPKEIANPDAVNQA